MMEQRSQPARGPVRPDDIKNYDAGGVFAQIASVFVNGFPFAARFNKSLRVGSGSATLAGLDGTDGFVMADGASAAFFFRDRADSTKRGSLKRNTSIILGTELVDLVQIDPTTGFLTLVTAGGWVKVTGGVGYTNGWADFDATETTDWQVAFKKYPDGTVGLRGIMKSGTIGATAFTLPAGYRPLKRALVVGLDGANTGQDVQITAAGAVAPLTGSNAFFSLTGIRFDTQ